MGRYINILLAAELGVPLGTALNCAGRTYFKACRYLDIIENTEFIQDRNYSRKQKTIQLDVFVING
jgi:hypothetical protein